MHYIEMYVYIHIQTVKLYIYETNNNLVFHKMRIAVFIYSILNIADTGYRAKWFLFSKFWVVVLFIHRNNSY